MSRSRTPFEFGLRRIGPGAPRKQNGRADIRPFHPTLVSVDANADSGSRAPLIDLLLEQAMDGPGVQPGALGEALGAAAGRGTERHPDLGPEERKSRATP